MRGEESVTTQHGGKAGIGGGGIICVQLCPHVFRYLEGWVIQLSRLQRILSHRLRPVPWVHDPAGQGIQQVVLVIMPRGGRGGEGRAARYWAPAIRMTPSPPLTSHTRSRGTGRTRTPQLCAGSAWGLVMAWGLRLMQWMQPPPAGPPCGCCEGPSELCPQMADIVLLAWVPYG